MTEEMTKPASTTYFTSITNSSDKEATIQQKATDRPSSSMPWHLVNVVSYLFNFIVSYGIGVFGLLNGTTNREQSAKYLTIISPVGYTFAIWGPIFIAQFIWVVAQVVAKHYRNSDYVVSVGYNYLFISLAQAGWTIALAYEQIEIMVACKLAILFFSWRIVSNLANITEDAKFKSYMIWKFPFSIHLGFLLAVTAINVSILFVYLRYSAEFQFIAGMVSVAVLLSLGTFYASRNDFTIPSVLIWSLIGVYNELSHPKEVILGLFTESQILYTKCAAFVAVTILASNSLFNCFQLYCGENYRQYQTVLRLNQKNSRAE